MRCGLAVICTFLFCQARGQLPVNVLNANERACFGTLVNLATYLRNEKTPLIDFHETERYNDEEKFYDKVIDSFFSKDSMLSPLRKNSDFFVREGKLDLVRHILNGIDRQLDTLSEKSILIEPGRYAAKNFMNEEENSLNVFVSAHNKKTLVLVCYFNAYDHKLLGFALIGGPVEQSQ